MDNGQDKKISVLELGSPPSRRPCDKFRAGNWIIWNLHDSYGHDATGHHAWKTLEKESAMPKEQNIPFRSIIEEVFGTLLLDYGFELQGEVVWDGHGEYSITANKDDIELNFYLGITPLYYLCDVGLKLLGELGEMATANPKYRSIGVTVIAECLDPEYKNSKEMPQTKDEVEQVFRNRKEELLKYCENILQGDVSSWTGVVGSLTRKRENLASQVQVSKVKAPKNKPVGLIAWVGKLIGKK